jgi:nicotinate-nucleotide adenylyltransferase
MIAEHVRTALGLQEVLFVPGRIPPHKRERAIAPPEERWEMLLRAIEGNPRFRASDIELRRPGVSYTVDTLRDLSRLHGGARLFFLLGADNVAEFEGWRDPEGILRLARLAVMRRPGTVLDPASLARLGDRACVVDVPLIGISSHMIRERVGRGESIRYLVPDTVRAYVEERRLYILEGDT